ncbi:hypothetical protein Ami103574_10765 [Aminipila butyrica]|uniref:Uncharacterized protein n=1 Tax=Aminipila butyrica TaxID=433296 RepID=A0A858BUP3_9FIRM|nr:hypothetical protein [Aminipila butyrica]QIB69771.1 hypothetical protein Ami103574_10765 [Aminipila butyrica]
MNEKKEKLLSLVRDLTWHVDMKENVQISLNNSNEILNKANLFTKLFKKGALADWQGNKEKCERDLIEHDMRIGHIEKEIAGLGYTASETTKIQDFLSNKFWTDNTIELDHPWVRLLNPQEKDDLVFELALDRGDSYPVLINSTKYIEGFKTDTEKINFIRGFNSDYKNGEAMTDAYKLGELFYKMGYCFGLDLEWRLAESPEKYSHDLTYVTLVCDLEFEEATYDIAEKDRSDPSGPINYEKAEKQLSLSDQKIKDIQSKLSSYKFYGRIDYIGQGGKVGESLFYDNYSDYKKEITKSQNCGRPISAKEITQMDYSKKDFPSVSSKISPNQKQWKQHIENALHQNHPAKHGKGELTR